LVTVKFFGGAKKSFSADQITIDQDGLTIEDLLDTILKDKPKTTPELDIKNILVAVNDVDSSVLEGNMTVLKSNDVVSIIPIIHGGVSQRTQFDVSRDRVELMEISKQQNFGPNFLTSLRIKFPKLCIQGISSQFILNKTHTKKILSISLAAKKNDVLLSKKIETDLLMRFTGNNQISEAIKTVGIKKGKDFFLIAIGKKTLLDQLYKVVTPYLKQNYFSKNNNSFLKKHYHLSKKQINAIISNAPVEDLLVEKASILV